MRSVRYTRSRVDQSERTSWSTYRGSSKITQGWSVLKGKYRDSLKITHVSLELPITYASSITKFSPKLPPRWFITDHKGRQRFQKCLSFCPPGGEGDRDPLGTHIWWRPLQVSVRILLECILIDILYFCPVIGLKALMDPFASKFFSSIRNNFGGNFWLKCQAKFRYVWTKLEFDKANRAIHWRESLVQVWEEIPEQPLSSYKSLRTVWMCQHISVTWEQLC